MVLTQDAPFGHTERIEPVSNDTLLLELCCVFPALERLKQNRNEVITKAREEKGQKGAKKEKNGRNIAERKRKKERKKERTRDHPHIKKE